MQARALATLVFSVSMLVASGCGGPPEADALYGLWANVDAGQVRVLEFAESDADAADLAGITPVYHIYSYPEGTAPVEVQRGGYAVMEDSLVTTVYWDASGSYVGQSFGNLILDFNADQLVLEVESAPGGQRVYEWVEALP